MIPTVRGSEPRAHDQFFTAPVVADACLAQLSASLAMSIADFDAILEPSFGAGAFISALLKIGADMRQMIFIDIDATEEAHRRDFLTAEDLVGSDYFHAEDAKSTKRCLTIGNPPFGKNASLAVAFFNRAALFSCVIAFILPRTFQKASIQNKLNRAFFLIHEEVLPKDGFVYCGAAYSVPCVFQVWVHVDHLDVARMPVIAPTDRIRPLHARHTETSDFTFVNRTQFPDCAIRRVGANAGKMFVEGCAMCNVNSHFFIKIRDAERREQVLRNIEALNLQRASVKFYTAGNPSLSKSELCELYTKAHFI